MIYQTEPKKISQEDRKLYAVRKLFLIREVIYTLRMGTKIPQQTRAIKNYFMVKNHTWRLPKNRIIDSQNPIGIERKKIGS